VQPLFDVFHPSRPSAEYLKSVHFAQSEKSVTYSEVGRSIGELPSGYHHLNARRTVGTGDALMQLGRAAINTWSAQAELKLDLYPAVPEFVEGTPKHGWRSEFFDHRIFPGACTSNASFGSDRTGNSTKSRRDLPRWIRTGGILKVAVDHR
jgi:hypothetical protein